MENIKGWVNDLETTDLLDTLKQYDIRDMINRVVTLEDKLQRTAEEIETQVNKMTKPINNTVNNINYLLTDYNEMYRSLKRFNLLGAAKHTVEAVYHTIKFAGYMKDVLNVFRGGLFPAMSNILKR